MRSIHPNLFAQVMRLPASMRADLLEFLGATPVEDAQLRLLLTDATARIQDANLDYRASA